MYGFKVRFVNSDTFHHGLDTCRTFEDAMDTPVIRTESISLKLPSNNKNNWRTNASPPLVPKPAAQFSAQSASLESATELTGALVWNPPNYWDYHDGDGEIRLGKALKDVRRHSL